MKEKEGRDITNLDDIKLLVDSFYEQVRSDDLLGAIFHERVDGKWSAHLEKMYRFWQTILLEEHTYTGRPFPPHANLPVEAKHFSRWLDLFRATVDRHFMGEKAEEAKWRAEKMALIFRSKIDYYRNRRMKPLM